MPSTLSLSVVGDDLVESFAALAFDRSHAPAIDAGAASWAELCRREQLGEGAPAAAEARAFVRTILEGLLEAPRAGESRLVLMLRERGILADDRKAVEAFIVEFILESAARGARLRSADLATRLRVVHEPAVRVVKPVVQRHVAL